VLDVAHIVAGVHVSADGQYFLAILWSRRNTASGLREKGRAREVEHHSQPIRRPLFCSSSQAVSGLKYSIIARVEISSPVASF
jgi:hypothetical protein